jgi:hypothetical protein
MSFFDDYFRLEYHKGNSYLAKSFFAFLPKSLYFHCLNGFYLDYLFLVLRKWSLFIFLTISFIYIWNDQNTHSVSFLFLFLSLVCASYIFFKKNLKQRYFFIGLIFSQIFSFLAIEFFYTNFIEYLYLFLSLGSLLLLTYSLWPALVKWSRDSHRNLDEQFLGLSNKYFYRHLLFLLSAIVLTGSPGTFQFFIQENILTEIWSKSHMFLLLTLVCLTLNTVHTFTIGQKAFLGREKYLPVH